MGMEEMPQLLSDDKKFKAANRAQADKEWAAQVTDETLVTEEAPAVNPERVAAKATAEAELQALQAKVAAEKVKRAMAAARVKALAAIVNGPEMGEDAAMTGKAVEELKAAQIELRDADVKVLRSEQSLNAREAEYRKDFPESVN